MPSFAPPAAGCKLTVIHEQVPLEQASRTEGRRTGIL